MTCEFKIGDKFRRTHYNAGTNLRNKIHKVIGYRYDKHDPNQMDKMICIYGEDIMWTDLLDVEKIEDKMTTVYKIYNYKLGEFFTMEYNTYESALSRARILAEREMCQAYDVYKLMAKVKSPKVEAVVEEYSDTRSK